MRLHTVILLSLGLLGTVKPATSAQEMKELATLKGAFGPVAFSPDGKFLATGGTNGVKLWDVATWQERRTYKKVTPPIAFSPDGKLLAASGGKEIKVWELATRKERAAIIGKTEWLCPVGFSSDGKTLATVDLDFKRAQFQTDVRLWDLATGQEPTHPGQKEVPMVTIKMVGNHARFVVTGEKVTLREVADGKVRARLSFDVAEFLASGMGIRTNDPTGRIQASVGYHARSFFGFPDDKITLLNKDTKKVLLLTGHLGGVYDLAFTADGSKLASGDMDGSVRLWEVTSGNLLGTIKGKIYEKIGERAWRSVGHNSFFIDYLAFSHDGKLLILGGTTKEMGGHTGMKVWDMTKLLEKKK